MTGHDLAAPLSWSCRRELLTCRRSTHPLGLAVEWHRQTQEKRLRHISSGSRQLHVEFARSSEILVVIR